MQDIGPTNAGRMSVILSRAAGRPAVVGATNLFTGAVWLDRLAAPRGSSLLGISAVTFAPGARNRWHVHRERQLLLATIGCGILQAREQAPQVLHPGDVADVPAGTEYWHGAAADSLFVHLAVLEGDADATTWLEPVGAASYRAACHEAQTG